MRFNHNRSGMKRLVAYMLILAMLLTIMPVSAFAKKAPKLRLPGVPAAAEAPAEAPEAPAEPEAPAAEEAPAEPAAPEAPPAPEEAAAPEAPAAPEEPAEPESPAIVQELKVGKLTVAIDAEPGAFPEGTKVKAKKVDLKDIQKSIDEAKDVDGEVLVAVDITFTLKGKEVQPAEGKSVKVNISAPELKDKARKAAVVHIDDETKKPELVEEVKAVKDGAGEENGVSFEADSFSVYAVLKEGEGGERARVTLRFHNPFSPDAATDDLITTVYVKNGDCVDGGTIEDEDGTTHEATAEEKLEVIVYDPGLGSSGLDDEFKDTTFVGWEIYASNISGYPTDIMTIEEVRDWLIDYSTAKGFKEGDSVDLRVVLNKIYHVDYYDRPSESRPDIVIGAQTAFAEMDENNEFGSAEHKVSWPYTVLTEDSAVIENFKGWKVKKGIDKIVGIVTYVEDLDTHETERVVTPVTADTVIKNDDVIEITGDVSLEPYIATGNWLVFEEVRPGAPYTAPQFLEPEQEATLPSDDRMVLLGYQFKGWFRNYTPADPENGVEESWSDEYTGEAIDERTTVYAKWVAEERAPYTVIIWKQNLNEDNTAPIPPDANPEVYGNPYSYSESIRMWGDSFTTIDTLSIGTDNVDADYLIWNGENEDGGTVSGNLQVRHTGRTGETHYYTNDKYIGFTCARIDEDVTINPEGNSVVNVYYDRLIYNVKIYHARSSGNNYNIATTRQNNNTLTLGGMNWTGTINYHQNDNGTWSNDYAGPLTQAEGVYTETSGNYTYYYKLIQAAYGANIYNQWPKYNEFPNLDDNNNHTGQGNQSGYYGFVSWYMQNDAAGYRGNGSGLDTFKGVIGVMDEKILGDVRSTDEDDNYLIGRYDGRVANIFTYQIWQEALRDANDQYIIPDGAVLNEDYKIVDGVVFVLEESIQANTNAGLDGAQAPDYIGFEHDASLDQNTTLTNNRATFQYHYRRILNKIVYRDGVYVNPDDAPLVEYLATGDPNETRDTGIPYGADLSAYNKGGEKYYDDYPASYSGFVFVGWFIDETCTVPYTFGKMLEQDITVYAKFKQVEYRVFLHPQAGEGADKDMSLDYGTDNPTMCFKVTDGEKVSTLNPTRDDYKLIGWFTGDGLETWWDGESYKLNDTTVTTPYDYNAEGVYTDEFNKWGEMIDGLAVLDDDDVQIGTTPFNKDQYYDRFWVTKRLDLYAKWSWLLVGADGINVEYDAVEGTFDSSISEDGKFYYDPLLYADGAGATTPLAQYAPTGPEGLVFLYWIVQDWDETAGENGEGAYVDTAKKVYPGDDFDVNVERAKTEELEGHTEENPKLKYTVRLRAQYGQAEADTPTHITWYVADDPAVLSEQYPFSDDATFKYIQEFNDTLQINQAVNIAAIPDAKFPEDLLGPRAAYTFLGWGKGHALLPGETTREMSYKMPTDVWLEYVGVNANGENEYKVFENGAYLKDENGEVALVTRVAADELLPYEDLFAMWEKKDTFKVVYASDVTLGGSDDALTGTVSSDKIYEFFVDDFRSVDDASKPFLDFVYGMPDAKTVGGQTGVLKNVYDNYLYGGYRLASEGEDGTLSIGAYGTVAGTQIIPEADMVYYVKDVDPNYLAPYYKYTYIKTEGRVTGLWNITVLDDLNYADAGFLAWGVSYTEDDGSTVSYNEDADESYFDFKREKAYESLKVKSYHTKVDEEGNVTHTEASTVTVSPTDLYTGAGASSRLMYISIQELYAPGSPENLEDEDGNDFVDEIRQNRLKAQFSVIPYWVTFDGISVLAKQYRAITVHPSKTNLKTLTKASQKTLARGTDLFSELISAIE